MRTIALVGCAFVAGMLVGGVALAYYIARGMFRNF